MVWILLAESLIAVTVSLPQTRTCHRLNACYLLSEHMVIHYRSPCAIHDLADETGVIHLRRTSQALPVTRAPGQQHALCTRTPAMVSAATCLSIPGWLLAYAHIDLLAAARTKHQMACVLHWSNLASIIAGHAPAVSNSSYQRSKESICFVPAWS